MSIWVNRYRNGLVVPRWAFPLISTVEADMARSKKNATNGLSEGRGRYDFVAHPTRFERVTFAFGGQTPAPPIPEQRIYSIARMGCCKPPATTPQLASLLRATLPCETALWLFHDVDRRRKLKGWARTG